MFMRIIFKAIYIQNQEIVKVEINQPWKMCYEEGMKCPKTQETEPIQANPKEKARRSYVCFCVPSAGRWTPYRHMMASLAEALAGED